MKDIKTWYCDIRCPNQSWQMVIMAHTELQARKKLTTIRIRGVVCDRCSGDDARPEDMVRHHDIGSPKRMK